MPERKHKTVGKKRGSVVLEDWYAKDGGGLDPVGPWFDHFGPEKRRVHVRGYAVRMPSGRWEAVESVSAGKRAYQLATRTADARYTWAENIETAVREALKKTKARHIRARLIDESVLSSFLYPGRAAARAADPFYVYVFTEHGLGDPFYYEEVFAWFTRAAEVLANDPWYEDAGWDSLRAGVACFWVKPKMIA